ncbi:hypothetical protein C8Q74DRAFT_17463 [Fomes fomentarius]|nr:hypothetical protein C8Q74DRAFT_17463 [Fomes fomentarius]
MDTGPMSIDNEKSGQRLLNHFLTPPTATSPCIPRTTTVPSIPTTASRCFPQPLTIFYPTTLI